MIRVFNLYYKDLYGVFWIGEYELDILGRFIERIRNN